MPTIDRGHPKLTDLPVRNLSAGQLDLFNRDSVRVQPGRPFNPQEVLKVLGRKKDESVLCVDIGAGKLSARLHKVKDGMPQPLSGIREATWEIRVRDGLGFLEALEEAAALAKSYYLPVGISVAGVVYGTTLVNTPSLTGFTGKFGEKYGGDFARLFPSGVIVNNDAVAGAIAGTIEAVRRDNHTQQVIYIVTGGGVGGALYFNDMIWPMEPGHVKVSGELNPYGRDDRCNMNQTGETCIELAGGGGRAGIEGNWQAQTGIQLDGREISSKYQEVDELAGNLYDLSAQIVSHAIVGMAGIFGIMRDTDNPRETAIVAHGGVYRVPGYGARVHQIVSNHLGFEPFFIHTHEFSDNACEAGAGIAALVAAGGR